MWPWEALWGLCVSKGVGAAGGGGTGCVNEEGVLAEKDEASRRRAGEVSEVGLEGGPVGTD